MPAKDNIVAAELLYNLNNKFTIYRDYVLNKLQVQMPSTIDFLLWFAIICLCLLILDFLGTLSSKY